MLEGSRQNMGDVCYWEPAAADAAPSLAPTSLCPAGRVGRITAGVRLTAGGQQRSLKVTHLFGMAVLTRLSVSVGSSTFGTSFPAPGGSGRDQPEMCRDFARHTR